MWRVLTILIFEPTPVILTQHHQNSHNVTECKLYTLTGRTIATRVSGDPTATNNGLFYIFSDHLGSISVLATSNGNQVSGSKTAYYPFGSPRTIPIQTITDRNFTGQKENLELGLIYYNARYYVPTIGRFASADTIVPDPAGPQQFNRYAYTLNNPTSYTDPSGHDVDCGIGDPSCKIGNPPPPTPIPSSTPTPTSTPTPSPTSTPMPDPIEQQILGATVQIVMNGLLGHGVIINGNTLVTNYHWEEHGVDPATAHITIYDLNGNIICSPCNSQITTFDTSTGDKLDIMEMNFVGTPFANYPSLTKLSTDSLSSLIGQPIALISYQGISSPVTVQWATVTNTAYIANKGAITVPWQKGFVSGLEVSISVPQGSSGGAAAIVVGGQPFLIGVNSSHGAHSTNGYVAYVGY